MAKTFRKFRDDEWDDVDDAVRKKEERMQNRRSQRKTKFQQQNSTFDESDEQE